VIIGVPKEVKDDEYRVAITPAGVKELTSAGHSVYVEEGAGVGSSIPDADFVATGAKILEDPDDIWSDSDMILGSKSRSPRSTRGWACARTRCSSPTSTWRPRGLHGRAGGCRQHGDRL